MSEPSGEELKDNSVNELHNAFLFELRSHQDFSYAVIGGVACAVLSATLWATVTVATEYQIGYMAIGVGLICGFGVRYFGAGIEKKFSIVGAASALLGCALGNLMTQLIFAAHQESLGYFEVISLLNFSLIASIFAESFSGMDVFFYAIAAYEGYKFGVRNISLELERAMASGKVNPPAYANLRLPLVIGLFVLLSVLVFFVGRSTSGVMTYNYASGAKRSSGEVTQGRENGFWQTWWENGNTQSTGFYIDGIQDSIWTYYNEEGKLIRKGSFRGGVQEGLWTEYYPNGQVSTSGKYVHGRQTGSWPSFYESGKPQANLSFYLDQIDGPTELFYENGKIQSKGTYKRGVVTGTWTTWDEDGNKTGEYEYDDKSMSHIMNTWIDGKPVIVNGKGTFTVYHPDGSVNESGELKDGLRTGVWISLYNDGAKQEELEYIGDQAFVRNSWLPDGRPQVVNGEGRREVLNAAGQVSESGQVKNGLRTGVWTTYFPASDSVMNEAVYEKGKANGKFTAYFFNGQVNIKGTMENDERSGEWTWYTEDGAVESVVTFVKGKKDGTQLFYDSYGNILRSETYKMGELIASKVGS